METYDFKPHLKGDTFNGLTFQIKVNEEFLNINGASIIMQLRLNPTHPTAHELSTTEGNIEITNGAQGEFTIKEQIIDFPANKYVYEIQINFPDGKVKTYIKGNWVILQDIAR